MRSLLSNGSLAGSSVLSKSPPNQAALRFFFIPQIELARSFKITLDQTFWKHKNLFARLDLQVIFVNKNIQTPASTDHPSLIGHFHRPEISSWDLQTRKPT